MDKLRERVARAIADEPDTWPEWLPEADAVLAELGLTQAVPADLEARIVQMAEEYELRGDEGDYTPNEHERFMLIDFAHEVAEALAAPQPQAEPVGEVVHRSGEVLFYRGASSLPMGAKLYTAAPQPKAEPPRAEVLDGLTLYDLCEDGPGNVSICPCPDGNYYLAEDVDPLLSATKDRVSGEGVKQLTHDRDLLASALAQLALKAGIYNGEVPLTGPMLLMLCEDMANLLSATTKPKPQPQAEPVIGCTTCKHEARSRHNSPCNACGFWTGKAHDKWEPAEAQPQAEPLKFRKPETREELHVMARHARAHLAFINKLLDEALAEDGHDLEIRNPNRPGESWHFKEKNATRPQPQATAEDVREVGAYLNEYCCLRAAHDAWERIEADMLRLLEVGRE